LGIFILAAILVNIFYIRRYLTSVAWQGGQKIPELNLVVEKIKSYDKDIKNKNVMVIHPAYVYYLESKYIMLPVYYPYTIDKLVIFEGMFDKIKDYTPRYPSNMPINELRADYLIYDERAKQYLPQYNFLFNPSSQQIPPNFQPVYISKKVVVYKID